MSRSEPKLPRLPAVEDCIAWAAGQGYCFAQDAADEYGREFKRLMIKDDNSALYGTRTWVPT